MRTFASSLTLVATVSVAACSTGRPSGPSNLNFTAANLNSATDSAVASTPTFYVADYGVGRIVVMNGETYKRRSSIAQGVNGPLDIALDRANNLYVANSAGVTVTEYAPGTSAPAYTYSTGMVEPIFVTTDKRRHVYEVDSGNPGGVGNNDGFVNEYAQQSNTIVHTCVENGLPTGIAVDATGNVFLALDTSGGSQLLEYKGGLLGCKATALAGNIGFLTGIALDNQDNLIVADYDRNEVYVFAPPYTRITRHLTRGGFTQPYYISINPANTYAYVTANYTNTVYVVDLRTRKVVQKIDNRDRDVRVPAGTAATR